MSSNRFQYTANELRSFNIKANTAILDELGIDGYDVFLGRGCGIPSDQGCHKALIRRLCKMGLLVNQTKGGINETTALPPRLPRLGGKSVSRACGRGTGRPQRLVSSLHESGRNAADQIVGQSVKQQKTHANDEEIGRDSRVDKSDDRIVKQSVELHINSPYNEEIGRGSSGLKSDELVRKIRIMPFQELEKLGNENPTDVLMIISNFNSGFFMLLNDGCQRLKLNEHIAYVFKALALSFQDNMSPGIIIRVKIDFLNSIFVKERLDAFLKSLFQSLNVDEFFFQNTLRDVLLVFKDCFITLENLSYEKLFLHCNSLQTYIRKLNELHIHTIPEECNLLFNDIHCFTNDILTKMFTRKMAVVASVQEEDIDPPNDYREFELFPTLAELRCDFREVFLRANKAKGRYKTAADYLDVQYRLIREDFVSPLRDGIEEYLNSSHRRFQNIRVYENVSISYPWCFEPAIGFLCQFNVEQFNKINWEKSSKRLMYGSLLVLSKDKFQSMLFATVESRDLKLLKRGLVGLLFPKGPLTQTEQEGVYTVIEASGAYFEAYRHVLSQLQRITPNLLPMADYIVECCREVKLPRYLARDATIKFDFSCLIDELDVRQSKNLNVNVSPLTLLQWPSPSALGLDASQYSALQNAVNNEFVVIQGPPGTGKTYCGLKIARLLIENVVLKYKDFSPMLVICYTNHALDQFLEGIASFLPDGIVRVGGRCKSESLAKFTISEIKSRMIREKTFERNLAQNFWQINRMKADIINQLSHVSTKKFTAFQGVVSLRHYQHHIPECLMESLLKDKPANIADKDIIGAWLFENYYYDFDIPLPPYFEEIAQDLLVEFLNDCAAEECKSILSHSLSGDDSEDEMLHFEDEAMFENDLRQDDDQQRSTDVNQILKHEAEIASMEFLTDIPNTNVSADGFQRVVDKHRMKKYVTHQCSDLAFIDQNEEQEIKNVWKLSENNRWRLYRLWRHRYVLQLTEELRNLEIEYNEIAVRCREIRMARDRQIIREAKVVAVTTTTAARYGAVLDDIQPKIVIVEEAAEVLESHVVASLSQGCQHLILIGDHEQLKPNPAVYRLAKNFNLSISLFERMIENDIHFDTLALQHRMRPEISALLRFIYPKLQDHEMVKNYDKIRGVDSSLFFIDHTVSEIRDNDVASFSNKFEAEYASRLCKYLIMQGYEREKITILTPYSGQLFMLRQFMPKKDFQGVRICVVDNFQGEENDVIILSLVRSNADMKMGFVAIKNRICVSLSRAKKGLFVLGNFSMLQSESLWNKIIVHMRQTKQIGRALSLRCTNHPEEGVINAALPADFDNAPEGGCMKPCVFRLSCGHVCAKACHPTDVEHKLYKCHKPCTKTCAAPQKHPCSNKCFEACGSCRILVEKVVPQCGHLQNVPCYKDPKSWICQSPCEVILMCGHRCIKKCGEPCELICRIPTLKTLKICGHRVDLPCYVDEVTYFSCPQPCDAILSCNHKCAGTCGSCLDGRLHQPCKEPCTKVLVCGHTCREFCNGSSACPPCTLPCPGHCGHSKCSMVCGLRCTPCKEPCLRHCQHKSCNNVCDLKCSCPPCELSCEKVFKCDKCKQDFKCPGLCGEKHINRCLRCNPMKIVFGWEQELDARFIRLETCQHVFEVRGLDQWISQESNEIVSKRCPQCLVPITARSCNRYVDILRNIQLDVDRVKDNIVGCSTDDLEKNKILVKKFSRVEKEKLSNLCFQNENLSCLFLEFFNIEKSLSTKVTSKGVKIPLHRDLLKSNLIQFLHLFNKHVSQMTNLQAVQSSTNIIRFVQCVVELLNEVCVDNDFKKLFTNVVLTTDLRRRLAYDILNLFKSLLNSKWLSFGETEAGLVQQELNRLRFIALLGVAATSDDSTISACVQTGIYLLKCDGDQSKQFQHQLERMRRFGAFSMLNISEKVEILNAMGFSKGHWFKCIEGHIYAIGDCGRANQVSKCPECMATIRGT